MNLRALFIASTILTAGHAYAQDCTLGDPETCNGTTLGFCDPVEGAVNPQVGDPGESGTFDCATAGAGVGCGDVTCVGTGQGCTAGSFGNNCVGSRGSRCIGFGPSIDNNPDNDDAAGILGCAGNDTCRTTVQGENLSETCVAQIGAACTPTSEAVCVGNDLVICKRDQAGTVALASALALDCTIFGAGVVCGNGPNGADCIDPNAAEGEGEGEGEGEPDRRDDEPEPENSGCPFNASGSFPMFGALALALVGLRRRR